MLWLAYFLILMTSLSLGKLEEFDPCCSFPCQNVGICLWKQNSEYWCDCTNTGYYGRNCETPYLLTYFKKMIKPSKPTIHYIVTHFRWFWTAVNNVPFLRKFIMKTVLKERIGVVPDPSPYRGFNSYPTWTGYANKSMYVRTLPPIPEKCPKPMGTVGPKVLPDAKLLTEMFFLRKNFEPCPERTSVVFPYFAQHFTHQFFKTDWKYGMPYQWGEHAVDMSQVYGQSLERQSELRSHTDGKMKYSVINGEMYPPLVSEAKVKMMGIEKVNAKYRFAIGHPSFTMWPPLLVFSTIWLREHNRVCDVLKRENPTWDDERLFQTSRLILIGETIKVVIEDYVQHLSGFQFKLLYDPELLFDAHISYMNEIHTEFDMLYHWHPLVPDFIEIGSKAYKLRNLIFNPKPYVEDGLSQVMQSASEQFAAKVLSGQGHGTLKVSEHAIEDGRRLRLQSFNNYRRKLGLKPYTTFEEFTGETVKSAKLRKLYGDIEAVELYIGLFIEKKRFRQLFGQTLTEIGAPYSLKGLLANPIGSPDWWKPSTFGGQKGFNIVKTTTLNNLICRNLVGCPLSSFVVPQEISYLGSQAGLSFDNTSQIMMKIEAGITVNDNILDQHHKIFGSRQEASILSTGSKNEL